jgi:hypothetical protein
MSQDTTMLHVYGWRCDGGPFFLDNPRTLEAGIAFAETVLKDSRRGFLRAEVKNIRTLEVLWTSAPVLRPGGVRWTVALRHKAVCAHNGTAT